jgi:hypothetical protein
MIHQMSPHRKRLAAPYDEHWLMTSDGSPLQNHGSMEVMVTGGALPTARCDDGDRWLTVSDGSPLQSQRSMEAMATGGARPTVKYHDGDRWLTASDGSPLQSQSPWLLEVWFLPVLDRWRRLCWRSRSWLVV